MTIVESKGGVPYILRETFDLVGRKIRLGVTPKWFCVRAKEFPCKIYFSEDDYNDDVNYVGVNPPSEESPNGEYIGSYDYKDLWIKGFNGSSEVELVATSAVSDLYLGEFSAGSVLVIPTSTIVTTKVGTFSSTWRGAGTLYFDPGDGGAIEPLVLTAGGVNWDHEYLLAGNKTIKITGDLNGVTYLSAPSNNVTNGLSEIISGLTNLVNLYLHYNSITGDISAVSGLTNLVSLFLYNNSITGDISAVSGLTNLVSLYLLNNSTTGDISAVSGLTNLVNLFLSNNSITGDISAVSGLTNLVSLFLSNNSITGDISAVSGLTNLVNLYLLNNSTTGDISAVSGLTNLVNLYLLNNSTTFIYVQFPAWSGSTYDLSSTVSTSQEVGDLIRAAANGGMNNCIYKLDGTNPAPPDTSEVNDAISTLAGNGVTLYVNT
jgi:internalin A